MKRFAALLTSLALTLALTAVSVRADDKVARVGEDEFTNFADALGSWVSGSTLTLLDDVTLTLPLSVGSGTFTLDLNGHALDRGLGAAQSAVGGGCVILMSGGAGSLTVTDTAGGGTITGGYNNSVGGGVRIDGGSFTLAGGTITGNRTADGYDGGGVYVGHNGGFTMSGGSITGNDCGAYGGGVYVYSGGSFTLSGLCQIAGNAETCQGTTKPDNVFLQSVSITIGGALDEDTRIGVTGTSSFAFTEGLSGNGGVDNFFADDPDGYTIRADNYGEAELAAVNAVTWKSGVTGVASMRATSDEAGEHEITRAAEGDAVYVHFTLADGYSPWRDEYDIEHPVWFLSDEEHYASAYQTDGGVYYFAMPCCEPEIDVRTVPPEYAVACALEDVDFSCADGEHSHADDCFYAGETVTVELYPPEGKLGVVRSVTYGEGRSVAFEKTRDNVYTFTMPAGAVTVAAAYATELTRKNVTVESFTYGEAQHPVVKYNGTALTLGTDYTVTYEYTYDGRTSAAPGDAGNYLATVTGAGDYVGTVGCLFTVRQARPLDDVNVAVNVAYGESGTLDLAPYIVSGGRIGVHDWGASNIDPLNDWNQDELMNQETAVLCFESVNDAKYVGQTARLDIPVVGATNYVARGGDGLNYYIHVALTITAPPTYTLSAAAPVFDAVYAGYARPAARALTIKSTGNSDATISGVALSGANAGSFTLNKADGATITAGGTDNTTYTIQPKAGLEAGTYAATVTVTYNGGATATADVRFTVYGAKGDLTSGALAATVTLPENANALLIAASYDSTGKQVGVRVVEIANGKTAYETGLVKNTGYTYKLMLVNKTTYAPLCAAWDSTKA